MTPENLVELLGDPRVIEKLAELMEEPLLLNKLESLLQRPALAELAGRLLQQPEVGRAALALLQPAWMWVAISLAIGGLVLAGVIFNAVMLWTIRRQLRA